MSIFAHMGARRALLFSDVSRFFLDITAEILYNEGDNKL